MKNISKWFVAFNIAGLVATTSLTVYGTVKAVRKYDEKKTELGRPLTKKEIAKATYKCYIAPAATFVATVGGTVGGEIFNMKTQAAMAATIMGLKKSYDKYGHTVKKYFGEEGLHKVKKDFIDNTKKPSIIPRADQNIYWLGYGFDGMFLATPQEIELANGYLNKLLRTQYTATVGDFLDYLSTTEPTAASTMYGWGRHEILGELDDGWLSIDDEIYEGDNGEQIHCICFNSVPNEDFLQTDQWYAPGHPLDREVPFDLDPPSSALIEDLEKTAAQNKQPM